MPMIETGQDSRHEQRKGKKSQKKHFQKWLAYLRIQQMVFDNQIFDNRKKNGERGDYEFLAPFSLLKSSINSRLLTVVYQQPWVKISSRSGPISTGIASHRFGARLRFCLIAAWECFHRWSSNAPSIT
jgi:hypothetical protein